MDFWEFGCFFLGKSHFLHQNYIRRMGKQAAVGFRGSLFSVWHDYLETAVWRPAFSRRVSPAARGVPSTVASLGRVSFARHPKGMVKV